jgi:dihydrofolate reductase
MSLIAATLRRADSAVRCSDNGPMDVSLIVALDRNYAIGRDGAMPWHLPDDLKRFKALTLGKPVLMGSKTARAIGRALPGRENLVMTRGDAAPFDGQRVVHSLDEAVAIADDRELAVIGGGEVFTLALRRATRMHLTWVETETAGADAFFPRLDAREWKETGRVVHAADARHALAFAFVDYVRV